MSEPSLHMSCRTLFISDLHLGSRTCDARALTSFLDRSRAETIVLVGDALDLWSLARRSSWTAEHTAVVRALLGVGRQQPRIIVVTGNHDDGLDSFIGMPVDGIEIVHEHVHETLQGDRLLVVHGDQHDIVMRRAGRLAYVADRYKERLAGLSRLRRRRPAALSEPRYASGRAWERLKRNLAFVDRFEHALAREAEQRGFDGVVCGHIHVPADRRIGGVRYINCGDWVKSCTAIVETWTGTLELVRWQPGDVSGSSVPGVTSEPGLVHPHAAAPARGRELAHAS